MYSDEHSRKVRARPAAAPHASALPRPFLRSSSRCATSQCTLLERRSPSLVYNNLDVAFGTVIFIHHNLARQAAAPTSAHSAGSPGRAAAPRPPPPSRPHCVTAHSDPQVLRAPERDVLNCKDTQPQQACSRARPSRGHRLRPPTRPFVPHPALAGRHRGHRRGAHGAHVCPAGAPRHAAAAAAAAALREQRRGARPAQSGQYLVLATSGGVNIFEGATKRLLFSHATPAPKARTPPSKG